MYLSKSLKWLTIEISEEIMIFTNFEALAGSSWCPQGILNIFPEVIKVIRMFKKNTRTLHEKLRSVEFFETIFKKKYVLPCLRLLFLFFYKFWTSGRKWPEVIEHSEYFSYSHITHKNGQKNFRALHKKLRPVEFFEITQKTTLI